MRWNSLLFLLFLLEVGLATALSGTDVLLHDEVLLVLNAFLDGCILLAGLSIEPGLVVLIDELFMFSSDALLMILQAVRIEEIECLASLQDIMEAQLDFLEQFDLFIDLKLVEGDAFLGDLCFLDELIDLLIVIFDCLFAESMDEQVLVECVVGDAFELLLRHILCR